MTKRRQSRGVGEALLRPTSRSEIIPALGETISGLINLDLNGLCLQWRNHLGGNPPAHLPRWLLLRILAYRIQAAALGSLDKETARHSPTERPEARIFRRASFRSANSDNAGWRQPESEALLVRESGKIRKTQEVRLLTSDPLTRSDFNAS